MMKKIFGLMIVLIIVGMFGSAFATSFLTDANPGVTNYKVSNSGTVQWIQASVVAQSNGALKVSVNAAPQGSNTISYFTCKTDPIWGETCTTAPTNFTFVRPDATIAPSANGRLIPD